ncbi:MAG: guanylate kinase [Candidatus Riflebacteria bacterium]|nr:guanylate kinase [Candidatus Riflebacteria bacterium]
MALDKPRLTVVVSGPSGAGKSTLCERFVDAHPTAELIITTTTREARRGEQDGIDYHFVTEEAFKKGIERGDFLEHALVHGNYYGSPRKAVDEARQAGRDVILEIDIQGGLAVKSRIPDALLIFVTPSDVSVLKQRLLGRGTDSAESIARRLSNVKRELERISEYNVFLFNDELDAAVRMLGCLIEAERHRIARYDTARLFNLAALDSVLQCTQ